jgi:hypothetical protein
MGKGNVLSLTHVSIKINNVGGGVEGRKFGKNTSNAKTVPDVSL